MTKEQVLQLMKNHVLQLKAMSEKGALIKEELLKLNEIDAKWFEENYEKWLKEQGFKQ